MSLEELCSRVEMFIAEPDSSSFDELAREIFDFQITHNRPYRDFCKAQGIEPDGLDSVNDVPAIITGAFKELDLSVLPTEAREFVFHSSGTTGHSPSRHFHSSRTVRLYERSASSGFRANVLPDLERANFLLLAPPPVEAPHSSLVHMFHTVAGIFSAGHAEFLARIRDDGSWSIDFYGVLQFERRLNADGNPVVICGTAFSFVHLCDFLADAGRILAFPEGSRVFETGGYKGRSRSVPKGELHGMISESLSIPETHIVNEYGMSELSTQAYDRLPGGASERVHRFPHWARAEVISPETGAKVEDGETGLLRVLDLANVGSVLAVQAEDIVRRCGSGFELLGRATQAESRGCSLLLSDS